MKAAYAKIAPHVDEFNKRVAPFVEVATPVAKAVYEKIVPKVHTNIPVDARVDRWVAKLKLTPEQIRQLYGVFVQYDSDSKGMITQTDFTEKILCLATTVIIEAMFDMMDTKKAGFVSFGEFVDIICTFAMFEVTELVRYCVFVLDREKIGYVDKNDIKHFLKNIWENNVNSNLHEAMDYLDRRDPGDGRFTYLNIVDFHMLYPSAFYPAFRLQTQLIRISFGIFWWENKKASIVGERNDIARQERLLELQRQKDANDEANMSQDELIYQRMGPIKYYLLPCLRESERQKIMQIAALSAKLDNLNGEHRDHTLDA